MEWWQWARAEAALDGWVRVLIGSTRPYTIRYGPGEHSYVRFDRKEIVIDPQVVDRLGGTVHLPSRWRARPVERLEQLQWHSCRAMARHEAAHVLFTGTDSGFAGATHQRLWNALEDGRIERLLGARYHWCRADFSALGRLALAHAQASLPTDRTRRCLAFCLLHRWDILRRPGTPTCITFADATDAGFWERQIRSLVEAAWQAADAGRVAEIALEILRRLGIQPSDSEFAAALPEGIDREIAGAGRSGEDLPEQADGAGLHMAASIMNHTEDPDPDAEASEVDTQAEPPRIDTDPSGGTLWARPYRALEREVIGAARRLARRLGTPAPNIEPRPSPASGRFDVRTYIRSQGETPLLRRFESAPDPGGLAICLLIDRTGSMGNAPVRIDREGNPSSQFTNPRGRMVHARAAAMLLERACAIAGIPLCIGYAGNNIAILHLPSRPTVTLPASVTWIRPWSTPAQAEGPRALIAGLYGDSGNECLSESLHIARHALDERGERTKLIIYIHDGEPTDETATDAAETVAQLRRAGIQVVGLFVGDQAEIANLEAIFGVTHTVGVPDLARLPERLGALVHRYWAGR